MYWEELDSMIKEKRSIHDLRYQVRDTNGKSMWVRCYGILKWNEDKTLPLFFSVRVSHQDDAFVIDPVTNFPREQALLSYLDEVKGKKSTALAIGFSFNSIAEINSTRGRTYSDHLVENIATDLMEKLSDKMSFYRLEPRSWMPAVPRVGKSWWNRSVPLWTAGTISWGFPCSIPVPLR